MRSRVESVEPVSTIMTSLTIDLTLSTAPASQSSSFLTIMHNEIPITAMEKGKSMTTKGPFSLKSRTWRLDTHLERSMVGRSNQDGLNQKAPARMAGN